MTPAFYQKPISEGKKYLHTYIQPFWKSLEESTTQPVAKHWTLIHFKDKWPNRMGSLGFRNITLARFFTNKKKSPSPSKQTSPNQQLKPNSGYMRLKVQGMSKNGGIGACLWASQVRTFPPAHNPSFPSSFSYSALIKTCTIMTNKVVLTWFADSQVNYPVYQWKLPGTEYCLW